MSFFFFLGVLDEDTVMMMNMPRCGVEDIVDQKNTKRKRRYSLHGRSLVGTALTYRIDNRTPDIPNAIDVDRTLEAALQVNVRRCQFFFNNRYIENSISSILD